MPIKENKNPQKCAIVNSNTTNWTFRVIDKMILWIHLQNYGNKKDQTGTLW